MFLLTFALMVSQIFVATAQAPVPCQTNNLFIGTGFNYLTNTVHPTGVLTPYWDVVQDQDPMTGVPRPANVIVKYPTWGGPLPNTQWIHTRPTFNNPYNGPEIYEFCFCVAQNAPNLALTLRVLADDQARVFLNGNLIGTVPAPGYTTPTTIFTNNQAFFRKNLPTNVNCIRIEVTNSGGLYAGLNAAGNVTSTTNSITRPECCDRSGVVSGTKWRDINCNGVRDAGEPGIAGWTMQLSNGQTAVTDANGNYFIMNVPPGTYTLNEIMQPGWTKTFPGGAGTHTVTVTHNGIHTGFNFGNCPQVKCFDLFNASIACSFLPGTTTPAYRYTFTIQNQSGFNARYLNFTPITPSTGITVTPNPHDMGVAGVPNGAFNGPINIFITGPNSIPGTTVKIQVRMCNDTTRFPKVCCLDTLEFTLPYCDCFEFVDSRIDCKWVEGKKVWTWCFRIKNQSTVPMYAFTPLPPPGITFTPWVSWILTPNPLQPGQTTTATYCVQISGTAAVPGAVLNLCGQIYSQSGGYSCKECISVTLPDCPAICCDKFTKLLHHLSNSASWTGSASLNGYINAWNNPGPVGIIGASFTIVSSTINSQPAYGYFTYGSIPALGGLGTLPPPPGYPYPHDIQWGLNGTANVLNNAPFNVRMQFPAMAAGKNVDTLRYCIRFRFTDKNCVTCDTVICFTRIRYRLIVFPGPIDASPLDPVGPIRGSLYGPSGGRLDLQLPEMLDGSGIRYVGLRMQSIDPEISIVDATSEGREVYTLDGNVTMDFNQEAGSNVSLDVVYSDMEGRNSVANRIILRYVLDNDGEYDPEDSTEDNPDTAEAEIGYVFRQPDAEGGDNLRQVTSPDNVQTFALHLENANASREDIKQLILTTQDGVEILSIGRVGSRSQAKANFGSSPSGTFLSQDIDGAHILLGPGESINPLYVTLSNVTGPTPIGFRTLNAFGQTISSGQITVTPGVITPEGRPNQSSGAPLDENNPVAPTTGGVMLQSIPNPTSNSATIKLSLANEVQNALVVVVDATGREVARLLEGKELEAGSHVLYFNTSDLPAGTYYYTLRGSNGLNETRSMQIVR